MMILWQGKYCSDGCPFLDLCLDVNRGVRVTNATCRLSGHVDENGGLIDIRLEVPKTINDPIRRASNCPFSDPRHQSVSIKAGYGG